MKKGGGRTYFGTKEVKRGMNQAKCALHHRKFIQKGCFPDIQNEISIKSNESRTMGVLTPHRAKKTRRGRGEGGGREGKGRDGKTMEGREGMQENPYE